MADNNMKSSGIKCPLCDKRCKNERGIKHHAAIAHKDKREEILELLSRTEPSPLSSLSSSPSSSSLLSGTEKSDGRDTQCPVCKEFFKGFTGVKSHTSTAHPDYISPSTTPVLPNKDGRDTQCPVCGEFYKGLRGVNIHAKAAHPEKCEMIKNHFKRLSPSTTLVHRDEDDKEVGLGTKNRNFQGVNDRMQRPSSTQKDEKEDIEKPPSEDRASGAIPKIKIEDGKDTQCPVCLEFFKGLRGVNMHASAAHPNKSEMIKKDLKCTSPSTTSVLQNKVDKDDGSRTESPDFYGVNNRLQHARPSHKDENEDIHEFLSKSRASGATPKTKIKDGKDTQCPVCGELFKGPRGVKMHAVTAHPEKFEMIKNYFKSLSPSATPDLRNKGSDTESHNAQGVNCGSDHGRSNNKGENEDIEEPQFKGFASGTTPKTKIKVQRDEDFCALPSLQSNFPQEEGEYKRNNPLEEVRRYMKLIKKSKYYTSEVSMIVNDLLRSFMNELNNSTDWQWTTLTSGSYYDGTKNSSADEFDFMLYPKMNATSVFDSSYPPGYCKVHLDDRIHKFKEITDDDNYIDPLKYKDVAFRMFDETKSMSRRHVTKKERDGDSPAYTIIYDTGVPDLPLIDIDFVPCIEFDNWPSHAVKIKAKWLTEAEARKCMGKHHVVAKLCPIESAPERKMLWRLSFSWAEKLLIHHANRGNPNSNRKNIFRILKYLLEETKKENYKQIKKLCSYHLKMYMLRWYDQWPNDCEEDLLRHRFIEVTRQLQKILLHDPYNGFPCIKNYFLPHDNVIGHVPQRELDLFCKKLRKFHSSIL